MAVPAVGTKVAFRLRPYGEWVEATVVDKDPSTGGPLEPSYLEDAVHLAVAVDRRRHHSARSTVLRLDVTRGGGLGQYLEKKPRGADEQFAKEQEQRKLAEEIGQRLARGEDAIKPIQSIPLPIEE